MTVKAYAGIGSRETPADILALMTLIARRLDGEGWILRSGDARGADRAFQAGSTLPEVYRAGMRCSPAAYELAERFHPAWDRCGEFARNAHARNGYILLGKDLATPVNAVVCWTPNGMVTGGTGQALRLAEARGILVLNLADEATRERAWATVR